MGCGIIKNAKENDNENRIRISTPHVNIHIITNNQMKENDVYLKLEKDKEDKTPIRKVSFKLSPTARKGTENLSEKERLIKTAPKERRKITDSVLEKKETQIKRLNTQFKNEQDQIKIEKKSFIHRNEASVDMFYDFKEKIGSGSYGSVFRVIHKQTGIVRALKIIKKSSLADDDFHEENFLMEISVLINTDHPNIMRVYEYFIDKKNYFIIMEYIQGKDLWTYVSKLQDYNEKLISIILKQLLSALSYLHSKNIVHRDIKPENIIIKEKKVNKQSTYSNPDFSQINSNFISNIFKDIQLVLIDFGNSNYYNKNNQMNSIVGTPYYISPDVLKENYSEKCDIWSCGIVLINLLTGAPPFKGKNMKETFTKILNYEIDFDDLGKKMSTNALDLIKKMIEYIPERRISAEEAFKHPFISQVENEFNINEKTAMTIHDNIKHFLVTEKFQQAALSYIIHYNTTKDDLSEFEEIFRQFDINGDGRLSVAEIKIGYEKLYGKALSYYEVENIVNNMDLDHNNFIEFSEFVRVALDCNMLINEKNLKLAFEGFDRDRNGCLDKKEIKMILGDVNEGYLEELMKILDDNGDGKITFDEFSLYMREIAKRKKVDMDKEKKNNAL